MEGPVWLLGGVGSVRKVLYVCNNHPTIRPGGMERYADELYQAVRAEGEFEPIFVARVGPPLSVDAPREGTRFRISDEDPSLYYFYTNTREFDRVLGTAREKALYVEDWRAFLRVHRPDVVHFHHVDWLGYDILRETRRSLPDAAIVYTLHEFNPICHHNGQMVRTETHDLCYEASPRRCHQCFPNILAQSFFLRERLIKAEFELVDLFIAPSEFLRQRYIEWGLAAEKIRFEDHGRIPVAAEPDPPDAGRRKRIGFFGQLTEFKGADVLLEAMKIVAAQDPDVQLVIRGANLDLQQEGFRTKIEALLEETADTVRSAGPYQHSELPRLMASVDWIVVPSIWWENAPLVIQEAMMHRRPVICSDIGGMAEKVRHGVTGLHFRARDPYSLADTIRRAAASPELWDQLRANITDPRSLEEHLEAITGIYNMLLDRGRVAEAGAAGG
jgi:glycosyltransferase involved in cell wall biosynthesis